LTITDIRFLLERDSSEQEIGFLYALWENPYDTATRSAYSDWLQDKNRHYSAEVVKKGYTPGGLDISSNHYPSLPTLQVCSGVIASGIVGASEFTLPHIPPGPGSGYYKPPHWNQS